jgi:hypothetical protein
MYFCLYSKCDFNIILLLEIYVTSNSVRFGQMGEVEDHNTQGYQHRSYASSFPQKYVKHTQLIHVETEFTYDLVTATNVKQKYGGFYCEY